MANRTSIVLLTILILQRAARLNLKWVINPTKTGELTDLLSFHISINKKSRVVYPALFIYVTTIPIAIPIFNFLTLRNGTSVYRAIYYCHHFIDQ